MSGDLYPGARLPADSIVEPFDNRKAPQYDRAADDWYIEPGWCVDLLLSAERFEGRTIDPACGIGTIPKAFGRAGLDCSGCDLRDRGYGISGVDFLTSDFDGWMTGPWDNIVTNPPYGKGKVAVAFIEKARRIASNKVAVVVNEKFLYSDRRHALFTGGGLYRVYFLSSRPSMPPGHMLQAGQIEAKGGAVNYAWLVFLRGYAGVPTCHWLKRPEEA